MFPKDSLILPSPPKFYSSHSLVCYKFSKVAWIKFRESVREFQALSSSPVLHVRRTPEKGPHTGIAYLFASSSGHLLWPTFYYLLALKW